MLKKILLVLGLLLAVFVVIVALQPAQYHVERSLAISAPPAAIFPQVNSLRNMQVWNPWMKLDPNIKTTFSGPAEGVGSSSSWEGNSQVGAGRQTITESHPNDSVRSKLEFIKPFAGLANVELTLKPNGPQTVVTWAMSGENNFISKAFCLFMNQDKMIGGPFEEGLATLKSLVESPAKK